MGAGLRRYLLQSCFVVCLTLLALTTIAQPNEHQTSAVDSSARNKSVVIDSSGKQLYPLSEERKEQLYSYSALRNVWRFADIVVEVLVFGVLLFTGISARFRTLAVTVVKQKFFALWLYWALFTLAVYLLSFPFHFYRGFLVEDQYGFMNQSFVEWLTDDGKSVAITILFGIIPVAILYWLLGKFKSWWFMFCLAAIPLMILSVILVPVYISPLFNEFKPLQDKQLRAELLSLAEEAGIEGSDVFQVDASRQSTKINAYVTGLFNTKRIVLYDNLLNNFSNEEILFVMGHEMAHYVKHHVWQGVALALVLILIVLWLASRWLPVLIMKNARRFRFTSLADMASLPLIALFVTVVDFVSQPVSNGFSRHMEHQADVFAMEITQVSGESASIAFDKLSVFNLSDPNPHPVLEWWFYSHPSLKKRMEYVKSVRP